MVFIILILLGVIFNLRKKIKKEEELRGSILQKENEVKSLNQIISEKTKHQNRITENIKEESKRKQEITKEIVEMLRSKDQYNAYQNLEKELTTFEVGLYNKEFDFELSEEYAIKIKEVVNDQKELIKNNEATKSNNVVYTDELKKSESNKYFNNVNKLVLRAFNNECDAAISKLNHKNFENSRKRINSSFEQINKLGQILGVTISTAYLKLKVLELKLNYEYYLKKEAEKEEQRRIREQMAEEAKVLKEIEKTQKEAQKEQDMYQKALEKAMLKLEKSSQDEQNKLNAEIQALQLKLKEAEEKMTRAKSMAEQTKSGHVYIISNIGSFGENIYKIGMTRRLVPEDRVKELSDASVPFTFDIHAMIHTDNAPSLENALHKEFEARRVNKVNSRKEFFNVSLEEIEEAVQKIHGDFTITKLAEAEEYRQTLEIGKQREVAMA
ncbi:DUF4041 domain-containing protein [Tepidibacter hydrothermalis]|uniref:DUF4041 domain-containing protein n=1 Tax=Tepidibacter hydrothermalis TaxID=3036126 RepID=A0ABY8EG94_9FIRM|nr:DUF4041 domain-containing protein [Tepidibacter hydrothermalis]WFD11979.1 DUF4041 domain-containing protein [Tepidibacter hydrothermalis]